MQIFLLSIQIALPLWIIALQLTRLNNKKK